MADLSLEKNKTALLMADFATIGIGENPIAQERHTLDRAKEVLDAARSAGIFVCYCISHFRPGFPEVSDRDVTRAARRDSGEVLPTDPLDLNLPSVLSYKYHRKVAKDNTVKYRWRTLQLLPTPDQPSYAGIRVEAEERMDSSLVVCYQGRDIPTQEAPPSLTAPQTPPVIRQIPLR